MEAIFGNAFCVRSCVCSGASSLAAARDGIKSGEEGTVRRWGPNCYSSGSSTTTKRLRRCHDCTHSHLPTFFFALLSVRYASDVGVVVWWERERERRVGQKMLMLQMMRTPFSHTHTKTTKLEMGKKELQFKTEDTLYIKESGCFPTSRQFAAFSYMRRSIWCVVLWRGSQ